MEYIKLSDRIEVLNFSVRTYNCLKKSGINTIEDLVNYPKDKLSTIKNMGNKSVQEVLNTINQISNNDSYTLVDSNECHEEIHTFVGDDGILYEDIEINYNILSTRAVNALRKNGYKYVSEIKDFTYDELCKIKNMGITSADRVYKYIIDVQFNKSNDDPTNAEARENIIIAREITKYFGVPTIDVLDIINDCLKVYPNAKAEALINVIYENEMLKTKVKDFIVGKAKTNNGLHEDELLLLMPENIHNTLILDQLLIELESDNVIKIKDGFITAIYISIIEYLEEIYSGNRREMLLDRVHGLTLEEIGIKNNFSRERARQVLDKELKKIPRTREDEFLYYVKNYEFSMDDFMFVFDEPETTYHYLNLSRGKNRRSLEFALEDEFIPLEIKRKIEKIVYKQYASINGTRILKRRPDLVKYYVRTACKESTHFDDFYNGYEEFLNENQLDNSLMIESRTYENHLQESNYVIWVKGKLFRYYNIEGTDFSELLDGLNLEQYENVEITSLKLFRENEKLMKSFDIRNENELHNLLKKICKINKYDNIDFSRNPTIGFGNVDRNEQVLNLMIQHAPISMYDLADLCEEMYGYKSSTAVGSYFKHMNDYCQRGMFRIDEESMSLDVLNRMKELLSEDIYNIDEVKRLFIKEYPEGNSKLVNSYNLKNLGFKVFSGYIVRDTYLSASEYLDLNVFNKDIVDVSVIKHKMYVSTFSAYIQKMKNQRNYVEYSPDKFVSIQRLNENGITVKDLKDYCNQAYKMVDKGEFFTVKSLRKKGFTHKLDELGFDDYFYSSILIEDERFSNRRMGNIKLLYCGNKVIEFIDLLTSILEENTKMDLYDLVDYLEDEYGIKSDRDKLKFLIKDSDMYYDQIMDAVYIDYDTYFEEV